MEKKEDLIREFNTLIGSMGVNIDQNLTIDWVKTELVNKAEQGDLTSVYKLVNLSRYYKDPEIVLFIVQNLNRLGYETPYPDSVLDPFNAYLIPNTVDKEDSPSSVGGKDEGEVNLWNSNVSEAVVVEASDFASVVNCTMGDGSLTVTVGG